jgi:hypothetical protein
MELAITIRLANPGSEDEGCFRREDLVVEVRQVSDANQPNAPTWRASCRCFTTDSLPRGYLGQLFRLRRILNSTVNARDS